MRVYACVRVCVRVFVCVCVCVCVCTRACTRACGGPPATEADYTHFSHSTAAAMAAAGAGGGLGDRGSAGAGGRESCVPHFDALWFCYCAPPAPFAPLPLPGHPLSWHKTNAVGTPMLALGPEGQ